MRSVPELAVRSVRWWRLRRCRAAPRDLRRILSLGIADLEAHVQWTQGIDMLKIASAMTLADVQAPVDRHRAGWFGHDLDAIIAVVSDDVVFHDVTNGERVEGCNSISRARCRDS
jgi:hypothetical protein